MSLITAPGFHPAITPEQYFAEPCPAPALTSSGIGILLEQSPAHFALSHPSLCPVGHEQPATTSLQYRGQLVHRLALGKGSDWQIIDAPDYRTKAAQTARDEAIDAGLIPVLASKIAEANAMADVLRGRIDDACEGHDYQTEVVIAWQEQGIWCRSMLDVWCPALNLAIDLKTTTDISDAAMNRAFARGYARQAAWYGRGLDYVTGLHGQTRFRFLFVEAGSPHLSRTAEISEAYRAGADGDCDRAIRLFKSCLDAGAWHSPGHYTATPPAWQVQAWAFAEMENDQ